MKDIDWIEDWEEISEDRCIINFSDIREGDEIIIRTASSHRSMHRNHVTSKTYRGVVSLVNGVGFILYIGDKTEGFYKYEVESIERV